MSIFRIAGQVINAAKPQIKNVSTQSTNPARSVSFGRFTARMKENGCISRFRSIAVIEQRRIQSKFDQVLKSQEHILPKISEHLQKIKAQLNWALQDNS